MRATKYSTVCNCEPETPGVLECPLGCQCRCHDLETQLSLAKKELEYAETTPASEVAKEVCALRDTNAALGLKVQDLEAQCAAMRGLLVWADWQRARRGSPAMNEPNTAIAAAAPKEGER